LTAGVCLTTGLRARTEFGADLAGGGSLGAEADLAEAELDVADFGADLAADSSSSNRR